MTDDTILPFSFPAVHAKKVTAAFDGGRLTSNGGVILLAMAERRLGLADKLARVFPDRRDPSRRRYPHATRHRQLGCSARLHRDAPQGKVLGSRTAHRRPYGGDDAGPRHPLRRHEPRY